MYDGGWLWWCWLRLLWQRCMAVNWLRWWMEAVVMYGGYGDGWRRWCCMMVVALDDDGEV